MTTLEKNRLIGVAFVVVGVFHLALLSLTLFGFSLTYPYIVNRPETASSKIGERAASDPAYAEPVVPGFPGARSTMTPMPPETKAQVEANRTMTTIYILLGIQYAVLLFILFAGFTVVNVRAGGRSLGMAASLFLIFFYPLGTVVGIIAIWFLTGDECLELYSEAEKDKLAPQSII
jgi:hypothetical protein